MNIDEQCMALAALDGWTFTLCDTDHPKQKCWHDPHGNEVGCGMWRLPEYWMDTLALDNIKGSLTPQEKQTYVGWLNGVGDVFEWWADLTDLDKLNAMHEIALAPIEIQIEALLRTKGKWEGE